eukprot:6472890-Amphidinium_carterae.4
MAYEITRATATLLSYRLSLLRRVRKFKLQTDGDALRQRSPTPHLNELKLWTFLTCCLQRRAGSSARHIDHKSRKVETSLGLWISGSVEADFGRGQKPLAPAVAPGRKPPWRLWRDTQPSTMSQTGFEVHDVVPLTCGFKIRATLLNVCKWPCRRCEHGVQGRATLMSTLDP